MTFIEFLANIVAPGLIGFALGYYVVGPLATHFWNGRA